MVIVNNPDVCTGCLICEMACSFHHIRKYSRVHSSIRVNKSVFNPEKGAQIAIFCNEQDGNPICDLCDEEDSPFCIRFCPENVLSLKKVVTDD